MARTYTKVNWQDGTVLQPAKVTIDGTDYNVDPAVESGTTPVNATNLDKMDTAISNAVTDINNLEIDKIEQSAIELLEVTDTAPEHCSEGDMYYNTTTNLIYTATGTDTWGTTGELPSSDYLYIDLVNQQLYYYDGTNFNSYGGGGGSTEVYIQDTEPTEEGVKLWIDTGEIAQAHTEITNEYSTSTGLGYSANYVNNIIADTINKLLPNNLIRFETVTLTESTTLAPYASAYKGTTCPTISGYTPWFCYEVLGTNESSVRGYTHVISDNNVGCWITNFTNSSKTFNGVDFKVMYIKEV